MVSLEPPRGLVSPDVVPTEAEAWRAVGLSRAGLRRFVRSAQALVGLRGEVEVLLAGDTTLKRLNRQYRGKNKATDVLSFPGAPELAGVHAGDLAVSLETAARQAGEHGHTLRDEVRVLLLHGLLHLQGMDHESDQGEMAEREAELRRRLRLPIGLIARAESGAGRKGSRIPAREVAAGRTRATARTAVVAAGKATKDGKGSGRGGKRKDSGGGGGKTRSTRGSRARVTR